MQSCWERTLCLFSLSLYQKVLEVIYYALYRLTMVLHAHIMSAACMPVIKKKKKNIILEISLNWQHFRVQWGFIKKIKKLAQVFHENMDIDFMNYIFYL